MERIPPPTPQFGVLQGCSLQDLPAESPTNQFFWLAPPAWHLPLRSDVKASSVRPEGILTFVSKSAGRLHILLLHVHI